MIDKVIYPGLLRCGNNFFSNFILIVEIHSDKYGIRYEFQLAPA